MDKTNDVIINRLKALRKLNGLSQSEVAKALNVHPSTISNYESGKRALPLDMIGEFAALYDTTADDLLKAVSTEPKSTHMNMLKRPVPLHAPGIPLKALLVFGVAGMALTLHIHSETLFTWAIIFLIVYGVVLSVKLYTSLKSRTTYYSVSERDSPVYQTTLKEKEVRSSARMLMMASGFAFIGLFLVEGFIFVAFEDLISWSDEVSLVVYFLLMTSLILRILIKGAFGTLIPRRIPHEKASPTLGTMNLVISKGLVLVGYAYHVVILRLALSGNGFTQNMNPLIPILLIHGVFILLYLIFQELLRLHHHYTLTIRP